MVVWGLWQDGRFLFSTGSKSRKARNLDRNPNCIVCTEQANEAVIVEGVAEIADVSARRKFLGTYTGKYTFDMSSMEDDILSMKEPVFAVRPQKGLRLIREALPGQVHPLAIQLGEARRHPACARAAARFASPANVILITALKSCPRYFVESVLCASFQRKGGTSWPLPIPPAER